MISYEEHVKVHPTCLQDMTPDSSSFFQITFQALGIFFFVRHLYYIVLNILNILTYIYARTHARIHTHACMLIYLNIQQIKI